MMKKLIVLATVVTALGVGTATGLILSSAANPKLVVSCEDKSCNVQLPGALLDEMNRTMTKSVSEPAELQTADEATMATSQLRVTPRWKTRTRTSFGKLRKSSNNIQITIELKRLIS